MYYSNAVLRVLLADDWLLYRLEQINTVMRDAVKSAVACICVCCCCFGGCHEFLQILKI